MGQVLQNNVIFNNISQLPMQRVQPWTGLVFITPARAVTGTGGDGKVRITNTDCSCGILSRLAWPGLWMLVSESRPGDSRVMSDVMTLYNSLQLLLLHLSLLSLRHQTSPSSDLRPTTTT